MDTPEVSVPAFAHPSYQRVSLKDEEQLVREAKRDLHQFRALYELYFSRIYHYCYFHTFDQVLAEDMCADVFMKALEAFPRYTWKGVPFGAWLFKIASNLVKNHYRDKKQAVSLDDVSPLDVAYTPDRLKDLSDEERRLVVKELLKNTAASCRDVLILRFFEELSYKHIADRLEKTIAACKMQVKRCLERMKQEVMLKAPEIADTHPAFVE
ncbi:MAG TPA: sigma-70 family RNA polymerase sigma factor [bacterium]|nr:sigma-70 family RNA polymerase sigma factor [bacterium]